ncbi:hypothetical protein M9H77_24787 [Catharanthus roseus]|uniref:Uncharacterized protein n=1 Tax=Catharanthus roseus TaxID=4058 RepID=A0ACC0A726_CATRO|nr:hypothetical protein M9H77_24787 [Catharanthus roseus]
MASIVCKKDQFPATEKLTQKKKEDQIQGEDDEEEEMENNTRPNNVATHLHLKPNGPLDREVVLRRIRHRKRLHNVKKAVSALLSSPFASKNDMGNVAVSSASSRIKWVDDAFAAL